MKGQAGDRSVVDPEELDGLRSGHVPDPDGGVVRGGDDDVVGRVVHDAVHLLGVALEDGDHLAAKIGVTFWPKVVALRIPSMSNCFATTGSQPKKSQLGNQLNTVLFILARSAEFCAILSEIKPCEKIRLCFQRNKTQFRENFGKISQKPLCETCCFETKYPSASLDNNTLNCLG